MSSRAGFTVLVAAALLLMTLGAGFISKSALEYEMFEEARRGGEAVMSLAAASAQDFFRANFRSKAEQAVRLKKRMELAGRIIIGITDKKMTPERFLEAFPLPEGDSIIIFKDSKIRASKGDLTVNPYELADVKGEVAGPSMDRLARAGLPASCVMQLPGSKGTASPYLGHHFYIAQWDMVLGLWTDIGGLEEEQLKFFSYNFDDLKKRYDKIHFGQSGFIFVVDGKGAPVIAPGLDGYSEDLGYPPNSITLPVDKGVLNELRGADDQPSVSMLFDPPWDDVKREAMLIVHYVKAMDWYVAGVIFTDEITAPGQKLFKELFSGLGAAALFIFAVSFIFARRLSAPLTALAEYARDLPGRDFLSVSGESGLLARLSGGREKNEVAGLARSFSFMEDALRERVRELMETTAQRERIAGELMAAREMQMDLLPEALPEEYIRGRFSTWALLEPAREVGGDLYDCFMLDDERLCLVAGDVSDKGAPAALFMSMALTLIRSLAAPDIGPDQLMRRINDALARDNRKLMFLTLFIGVLDLRSGRFDYANGGHCKPVYFAGGKASWLEGRSGPSLGIKEGMPYALFSIHINPGSGIFLYTDGVTEAEDCNGELFGTETLLKLVEKFADTPPEKIGGEVMAAVLAHMGVQAASDDITILCARYEAAPQ